MSHHANWKKWSDQVPDEYRLSVLALIDWVGALVGETMILNDYGTNLVKVINEKLSPVSRDYLFTIGQNRLKTYLPRYYLLHYASGFEIYPAPLSEEWCLVALSMLYAPPIFTPFSLPELSNDHPLNQLRLHRQVFQRQLRLMANREDVTEERESTDSGLLFAWALVYGLRLAEVSVLHGATVTDNPALRHLYQSLSSLSHHFQRSWQWHELMVPR